MPSIQDVADQINARLDQISTNTANTAQNTADIRSRVDQTNNRLAQIDNTLAVGFANLSQGLFAILQVELVAVELLDQNRKQNDTIICELRHSNQLLCNIMRKFGHQLRLSEATLKSALRMEGIAERAHCCEAGDYDRSLEMMKHLEECCPPKPLPEEACPEACPAPHYRERQPGGLDWKPLPPPGQSKPIG
ncbi:MAG TPA: hypothetical protein VGF13_15490 [Verrucomicrobiae bacterium]|jgi:hypothetical protein